MIIDSRGACGHQESKGRQAALIRKSIEILTFPTTLWRWGLLDNRRSLPSRLSKHYQGQLAIIGTAKLPLDFIRGFWILSRILDFIGRGRSGFRAFSSDIICVSGYYPGRHGGVWTLSRTNRPGYQILYQKSRIHHLSWETLKTVGLTVLSGTVGGGIRGLGGRSHWYEGYADEPLDNRTDQLWTLSESC